MCPHLRAITDPPPGAVKLFRHDPNQSLTPPAAAPKLALGMKTADPELMRAINRYHVIDVIRRDGPIARVAIAERTELSPATVSAITGGLIEQGLIGVLRIDPPETAGRGRPRVLLEINPLACHVAGVKLAAERLQVTVTDARGEPCRSLSMPVRLARQSPEVVADLVEDAVRQCVADAGLAMDDLNGVGIGLPGVIDGMAGVAHWSPVLGPAPVAFADAVQRRLGVRVSLENDASLVALAEHWFGIGRGLATFAVVTVEDAIGLGLLIEGRIHRGAHGIGPEFGHVKIDPAGPLCRCGQRGCLDAYASDWGILQASGNGGGDMAALIRRAEAGEPAAAALFDRAGATLGLAIANLVNLLNPPRLVISGEGLRAGELLRAPLLAAYTAHAVPTLRDATEIVFHPWGDEMWARGAATLALRHIYEAPWNNA